MDEIAQLHADFKKIIPGLQKATRVFNGSFLMGDGRCSVADIADQALLVHPDELRRFVSEHRPQSAQGVLLPPDGLQAIVAKGLATDVDMKLEDIARKNAPLHTPPAKLRDGERDILEAAKAVQSFHDDWLATGKYAQLYQWAIDQQLVATTMQEVRDERAQSMQDQTTQRDRYKTSLLRLDAAHAVKR